MLTLELEVPLMSVSGFPCLLALELQNGPAGLPRVGLPQLSPLEPPYLLGLRWAEGETTLAQVRGIDPDFGESPLWEPSFRLLAGQSRRQLVDLDLALTPVPPGHGQLTLDDHGTGCSASCTLAVAEATDAERRVLARRAPQTHWLAQLVREPLDEVELSTPARESLALYLAWAEAIRAPNLAELRPSVFTELPAGLAPEAACFDYERALACGDDRAPELRRSVEQRWPGLGWRLTEVDAGRGMLKFLRKMLRR